MKPYKIAMLALFAVGVITLIVLKALNFGSRRRGVVKCVCSALFVAMAAVNFVGSIYELRALALLGVAFAALGDVFLVFMDKRLYFLMGVVSFSCASLCLSMYSFFTFGWQWWFVFIFVAFVSGLSVGQVFKVIDFGRSVVYLNIYSGLVALCGSLGFTLVVQGAGDLPSFLFGMGCFMYFISDICLGLYLYTFKHNRLVDCINTMLYFPGLMLVALSL